MATGRSTTDLTLFVTAVGTAALLPCLRSFLPYFLLSVIAVSGCRGCRQDEPSPPPAHRTEVAEVPSKQAVGGKPPAPEEGAGENTKVETAANSGEPKGSRSHPEAEAGRAGEGSDAVPGDSEAVAGGGVSRTSRDKEDAERDLRSRACYEL